MRTLQLDHSINDTLANATPANLHFGRKYAVLTERDKIERLTAERKKREYLADKAADVSDPPDVRDPCT